MTATTWVLYILGLIIGSLTGFYCGRRSRRTSPDGIFRVDTTNPEKDIFTVELMCPIGSIPTKDVMIFKVENVQEKPRV